MTSSGDATPDAAPINGHVHVAHRGADTHEGVAPCCVTSGSCAVNTISGKAEPEISTALEEWHSLTGLVIGVAWRRLAHRQIELVANGGAGPPLRNRPKLGVLEAAGEKIGDLGGEAGVASFGLGVDGAKSMNQLLKIAAAIFSSVRL